MSKEQRLQQSLSRIDADTVDVLQVWREEFAKQITPDQFRAAVHALRQIPEDIRPDLLECLSMNVEQAFRQCVPDYVGPGEFAAAAREKQQAAQKPFEAPAEIVPPEPPAAEESSELGADDDLVLTD